MLILSSSLAAALMLIGGGMMEHFSWLMLLRQTLWVPAILVGIPFLLALAQKRRWNHGICRKCSQPYRYDDSFYETAIYKCKNNHELDIDWFQPPAQERERSQMDARV